MTCAFVATLGVLFASAGSASASTQTTVILTVGETSYSIPAGTSSLQFEVVGAAGALGNNNDFDSPPADSGSGAEVEATLNAPFDFSTLYAEVGKLGGGGISPGAAAGGGESAIQTCSVTSAGCTYTADPTSDPRLIVAGGGGGGGDDSIQTQAGGGVGGNAGDLSSVTGPGAGGSGSDTNNGFAGLGAGFDDTTATVAGGAGSADCSGESGGGAGGRGSPGHGGAGFRYAGNGGGGGGDGWVGGSGGGEGGCGITAGTGGGGGAGGSFVTSAATNVSIQETEVAPEVIITATIPASPTVTLTTPNAVVATYTDGQVVDANYSCTAGAGGGTLKTCAGTVANGSPIPTGTVGSSQSFSVTATDLDGQSSTVTHFYNVVAAPPSVTLTTPPSTTATYTYGQVVAANYSCTAGAGSTLSSCAAPVASGSPINTSTVGNGFSFNVTATDADSQSASVANSYNVKAAPTTLTALPQFVVFEPVVGVGLGVVQATLKSGGTPVSGQTISFTNGSTALCHATTNSAGVARCTISELNEFLILRTNTYRATFAGTTDYVASTTTTPVISVIP